MDKKFNEELRQLRVCSKIKGKEVAKMLGKSAAWVTKMENGELTLTEDTYKKIKSYFSDIKKEQKAQKEKEEQCELEFLREENRMLKDLLNFYTRSKTGRHSTQIKEMFEKIQKEVKE